MDVLGQDGSDGLHEQDLHDDVFAPADVVVRCPRVAEQVSGSVFTATVWGCKHTHTHTHTIHPSIHAACTPRFLWNKGVVQAKEKWVVVWIQLPGLSGQKR